MTPWRHQKATSFPSHAGSTTSHIGISASLRLLVLLVLGPNETDFQPHRLARIARCDTMPLMYAAESRVAPLLFLVFSL